MNIPHGVILTLAFAAAVALGVSLAGVDVAVGLVVIMAFNLPADLLEGKKDDLQMCSTESSQRAVEQTLPTSTRDWTKSMIGNPNAVSTELCIDRDELSTDVSDGNSRDDWSHIGGTTSMISSSQIKSVNHVAGVMTAVSGQSTSSMKGQPMKEELPDLFPETLDEELIVSSSPMESSFTSHVTRFASGAGGIAMSDSILREQPQIAAAANPERSSSYFRSTRSQAPQLETMLESLDHNMSAEVYDELLANMLPLVEDKLGREVTLEDLTRLLDILSKEPQDPRMSNDSVITTKITSNRLEGRKCQTLPPRISNSSITPSRSEHWSASDDASGDPGLEFEEAGRHSMKPMDPERRVRYKARTMDDVLPIADYSAYPAFTRPPAQQPASIMSRNTGNIYTVTTDSFNDNSTTVQVAKQAAARRRRKIWDSISKRRSGRSSPNSVSASDSASDGDIELMR